MTDTAGSAAWRAIADQLTPDQIEELETFEQGTDLEPDHLLYFARQYAAANLHHSVEFGHIEPPPDAARCFAWQQQDDSDLWSREFWGEYAQPEDAKAGVFVSGRQVSDGNCERWVAIVVNRMARLTPAQARELARLLVEAAEAAG